MTKAMSRSFLERSTSKGDSPVDEDAMLFSERVGLPRLGVRIWLD